MAHFIIEECTGCGVCKIKCPVAAIEGVKKELHVIAADLCIDCGVCGRYCAFAAVVDPESNLVERIKPRDMPKALVLKDECSGCENCIRICPFDAITLGPCDDPDGRGLIAHVEPRSCVGCGLCQTICIKEAILVR